MDFTLSFLQVFFISVYLTAPLLLFLGAIIIFLGHIVRRIEKWTAFDGMYWSFITATTVGYGDIRPLKRRSKILSIIIALIGLMFTGIIIALTLNSVEIAFKKHFNGQAIEQLKEKFDAK